MHSGRGYQSELMRWPMRIFVDAAMNLKSSPQIVLGAAPTQTILAENESPQRAEGNSFDQYGETPEQKDAKLDMFTAIEGWVERGVRSFTLWQRYICPASMPNRQSLMSGLSADLLRLRNIKEAKNDACE